jgi:Protein of unknown function (DUF3108)
MMFELCLGLVLVASATSAPSDAECGPLPSLSGSHLPFQAGEHLDYEVDLLGGLKAGTVQMEVSAPERGDQTLLLPVKATAHANGLLASIGKIDSSATTWLKIHDLHPARYREDYTLADGKYWTDVTFSDTVPHRVRFTFGQPKGSGARLLAFGNDALDPVGVFFVLRSLEPKLGDRLCFDAYGSRRVWRIWGEVSTRETITTPAGTFATIKLSGHAVPLGTKDAARELDLWLTDDSRHLPVEAMGKFDLGPIRALLTGVGGTVRRSENDR